MTTEPAPTSARDRLATIVCNLIETHLTPENATAALAEIERGREAIEKVAVQQRRALALIGERDLARSERDQAIEQVERVKALHLWIPTPGPGGGFCGGCWEAQRQREAACLTHGVITESIRAKWDGLKLTIDGPSGGDGA